MDAGVARLDPVEACYASSRALIETAACLATVQMLAEVEAVALPGSRYGLWLKLEVAAVDPDLADTISSRWPGLIRAESSEHPVVAEVATFLAERVDVLKANALRLAAIEAVA